MSQVTASPPPKSVIDYNARPAPRRGPLINVRMVIFAAVCLAIIGLPTYMYLDATLSHGIHKLDGGLTEVDLKSMSLFPLDQQNGTLSDVPDIYRALDGKKVVLVGEIYAPGASGNYVGQFDLCYSIAKCCFSGPPQAQHFVKSVASKAGEGMPYYSGPVRVTGTLKVEVVREADKINSVYHMAVDSIDPVP